MNTEPTSLKQIKKLFGLKGHHNYSDIFREANEAVTERNALRESHSMISALLHIASTKPSDILKAIADVMSLLARPDTTQLLERCKQASERFKRYDYDSSDIAAMTVEDIPKLVAYSFQARNEIVDLTKRVANARPDTTQPQLSEIRYVLHGDIQPCSVLYSDETTTLLRLDEGDVMCETDTIEWSDSVTYRCQELLKSAADPVHIAVPLKTSKLFAQLVRDERILLNDNGDDALGADEAYFRDDTVKPCVAAVVPAPPPFPRGVADHNNSYVHTTTLFSEEAMRSHGWTNEALVSCGHGHYAPMQQPASAEER